MPHLTDEQRQSVVNQLEAEQSFYAELDSDMNSKPKHLDLSVTLKDLENRQFKLEQDVTAILNTPPPKEEKKEEKKEDEANKEETDAAKDSETAPAQTDNVEMKDEGAAEVEAQPAQAEVEAGSENKAWIKMQPSL